MVVDSRDAAVCPDVAGLGLRPVLAQTLMHTADDAAALARVVLREALGDGWPAVAA
jgi:hypothetical protein